MKKTCNNKENKYTAFLYIHFNEFPPEPSLQQVYAGVSRDGLHWETLRNNEWILASDINEEAARDPFIIRAAKGDKFYILATDQNLYREEYRQDDNPDQIDWAKLDSRGSHDIIVWESSDLVNWSKCWALTVGGSYNAGCCWAPKAVYDNKKGDYLLTWSSTVKSEGNRHLRVFAAKTKDFRSISEPYLYTKPQCWAIDTSVYYDENKERYYRLTKLDNRIALESSEKLYNLEEAATVKLGDHTFAYVGADFKLIENSAPGCLESFTGPYEGASMFKIADRDEYCILVDEYGNDKRGYIPFLSKDIDLPNSIMTARSGHYQMTPGAKHGAVIPINEEEYERLISTYGTQKTHTRI